jgi:hypothetical protein
MNLKKLIKEVLEGNDCCSATKPTKAPILNESLAPREILSEGLKYHIDNSKPLTEHVYRAGSSNYFNLWAEARTLYTRGILDFSGDDLEILNETHLGEFGIVCEIEIGDKVKASKEYGGLSGEVVDMKGSFIVVKTKEGNKSYHESDLKVLNKEGIKVPLDFIMEEIEEWPKEVFSRYRDMKFILQKSSPDRATYQIVDLENNNEPKGNMTFSSIKSLEDFADDYIKPQGGTRSTYLGEAIKKKDPPIGKPKRGGSKKFYVYVRNPKTKKIKKVSFGGEGLKAKINNPKARKAFAARHNCAQKNDKTKASYWSCRLPRYAKLLGLKSNFSGFW